MRHLLIALAVAMSVSSGPQTAIQDTLRAALANYDADKLDLARAGFDAALAEAQRTGDVASEAEARRGIGLVLLQQASYPAAGDQFERSLALFEQLHDVRGRARVQQHLARAVSLMGDQPRAQELYKQSLAGFESLGDVKAQVRVLIALDFVTDDDDFGLLNRAEALAASVDDKSLLGSIAHNRSDTYFARGEYATAITWLETAIGLLEQSGDNVALARALTSLGRLNRMHGRPERSIDLYKRALALQEALGDQQGVIQTINATGVAYETLNKYPEALAQFERALALARKTGAERIINFQLGNLGAAYVGAGQNARGAAILEDVVRKPLDPALAAGRYAALSNAYQKLGRYTDAIAAADRSIAFYRERGDPDAAHVPLINRAVSNQKLGRTAPALADAREVLALLEHRRTKLVPSDYMKQGYGETVQEIFALAVSVFHDLHEDDLALETAARAEGRAFLDLLASRGPGAAAGRSDAALGSLTATLPQEARERASPESAASSSVSEMRATARRLQSTLVAYFVCDDTTYVWVVPAGGEIRAAQIPVPRTRLAELVRQTRPGARAARVDPAPLRTRGGDVFVVGVQPSPSWRALYDLLVQPIESFLPRAPGSRLTIFPHGPLSQLSFAALQDARGLYMIERYTLHYAPAAGALRFTSQSQRRAADAAAHYVLVADPAAMPAAPRGPLRALPGSRREVGTIAAMLPRESVSVVTGGDAREASVRAQLADATVIHFATHGIVRNDRPLESFLALGRTGDETPADGRLTAAEIYDLDLHADVVVLSACRSALGTVSGDGVLGLTRAFFYAGAASIVATMWDVADDPTRRLVPDFYRRRAAGEGKAEALRAAQLRLLRDLRAGRVKIGTGTDAVTLPENPFFWAAFVLSGEP